MKFVWVALRLTMGWTFFWAFIDKLFGLGFATEPASAWVAGGSPTLGYLKFATAGPFAPLFQAIAGNVFVDWLFMLGLGLIGLALLLGMGVQIAGWSGALMMAFMWLSNLPPANNPIVDDHIIYIFVLIGLATVKAGQWFGLGPWWSRKVKDYPLLV